jgi:hypothetical protein
MRLLLPSRAALALIAAFALAARPAPPASGTTVQHLRPCALDRTLACVSAVYGRPVLRHSGLDNRLQIEPCPKPRAELEERLFRERLRLFDAGEFALLIPAKFLPPWSDPDPYFPRMKWSKVRATLTLRPAEGVASALSQQIATMVLRQGRTIPIETLEEPQKNGEAAIELKLGFHAVQLRPGAPTAILALLDQLPLATPGRLFYGELRHGKYELLWDSPLFNASGEINFVDVDGDGQEEIVIESQTTGNQAYPILVIFDRNGRELTRQAQCDTLGEGFNEVDGVCAIKGTDIALTTNETGPRAIRVSGWNGDGKDHLFRLQKGTYVPGPPLRPSP